MTAATGLRSLPWRGPRGWERPQPIIFFESEIVHWQKMFSVRHDNILNFILRTWKQVGCVFLCILLKEDIGVALWELRTPRPRCGLSMGGHCEEKELIPSPSPVYAFGSFLRLKKKKSVSLSRDICSSTAAACFHFLTPQFLEISAFPECSWSICTTAELSTGFKSPQLLCRQWTRTTSSLLPIPERTHVLFHVNTKNTSTSSCLQDACLLVTK